MTFSVFCQNKQKVKNKNKEPSIEETQKWIKSVIDIYGTGNLKFENDKIYYYIPSYSEFKDIYNQEVLLKNLSYGKLHKAEGQDIKMYIHCLNGKCVYVDCKKFNFYDKNLIITLKDDTPDEMLERLLKAFNQLAKLSNGNKIGNTF